MDDVRIDWTAVWLFALTCGWALAGWWVKRVDWKLDGLEQDVSALKVADASAMAGAHASSAHLDRIERMLVRIDEKLDSKADKATCTAIHGIPVHRGPGAD